MATAEHPLGYLGPQHDCINVIQIMMDQLPFDALGCYGHPLIKTPNLDALAANGIRFTNAYAQSTVCCPSRASQLSGLYPGNHGITSNMSNLEVMNPYVRLLSDRFHEEGYGTAHFGKWHCLRRHQDCKWTEFRFLEESVPIWPQADIAHVYEHEESKNVLHYGALVHAAKHPCDEHHTGPALITDWSIDFAERFAYKPFFLRVSYLGPHAPVLAPAPYHTMYDPDEIELPDYAPEEFENRPEVVRSLQARCLRMRADSPDDVTPEQAIRLHIAHNLGLISHIDDQIGRLMETVRAMGLEGQTVVMFTADHGGFWGEHGLLEKSGFAHYRRLLQLPLIVACPGLIPAGRTYDGLIEEVDFYPTLLDLAGIEHTHRINGRSFKAAVLGDDDPGRDDVFAEFLANGRRTASLRNHDWHFIWHAPSRESELYDMATDPNERTNLAGDPEHREIVTALQARLLTRIMINGDVELLPDDAAINRSPIYLTPGHDEKGHEQALIRRFRGDRDVNEFPGNQPITHKDRQ